MCPLRIVLIFLSATCAAFLFLNGVSASASASSDSDSSIHHNAGPDSTPTSRSSKISGALSSWFWTCVDMASGRYLWRTFSAMNKPATD